MIRFFLYYFTVFGESFRSETTDVWFIFVYYHERKLLKMNYLNLRITYGFLQVSFLPIVVYVPALAFNQGKLNCENLNESEN